LNSWLVFKIAKSQENVGKMGYYAEGIKGAQKEFGLEIVMFPQHGTYASNVLLKQCSDKKLDEDERNYHDYVFESEAQRGWRERMEEHYYYSINCLATPYNQW
jgi:hypothetical protein